MRFALGTTGGSFAKPWRSLMAGCVMAAALAAGVVEAAPIPLEGRQVDMTAREQPIASFLQDFFGTLDMPVSVSGSAKGAVNGVFRGPADRVLANILRSFGLMAYYDGAVVHIYTPGEISTRTFSMREGNASAVINTARDMRLTDARNTLRVSQNGALIASGTSCRFCSRFWALTTISSRPLPSFCSASCASAGLATAIRLAPIRRRATTCGLRDTLI